MSGLFAARWLFLAALLLVAAGLAWTSLREKD
jgi:hypothetical protein